MHFRLEVKLADCRRWSYYIFSWSHCTC